MRLNLNYMNLEQAIYDYAKDIGREGTRRLAGKLKTFVKENIPSLSPYGQINAAKNPHPYRAKKDEIKNSTIVIESKRYTDSFLVNVRDWRAHFMEFPTQAHDRKPRHAKAMKFVRTDNTNKMMFTKKTLHHPGTKGARVFEKANDKTLIEKYIQEIAAELNANP